MVQCGVGMPRTARRELLERLDMILRSETQALLREMETMPLFENIGTGEGSRYEKVDPFEEALERL